MITIIIIIIIIIIETVLLIYSSASNVDSSLWSGPYSVVTRSLVDITLASVLMMH